MVDERLVGHAIRDEHTLALNELEEIYIDGLDLRKMLVYYVDGVDESALPALAFQFNVLDPEFSLASTVQQKRDLIKNALKLHRYRGTPWAIKNVFDMLGIYAELTEWFEFAGLPGRYMIKLKPPISQQTSDLLISLIKKYKRKSSKQITHYINDPFAWKVGAGVRNDRIIKYGVQTAVGATAEILTPATGSKQYLNNAIIVSGTASISAIKLIATDGTNTVTLAANVPVIDGAWSAVVSLPAPFTINSEITIKATGMLGVVLSQKAVNLVATISMAAISQQTVGIPFNFGGTANTSKINISVGGVEIYTGLDVVAGAFEVEGMFLSVPMNSVTVKDYYNPVNGGYAQQEVTVINPVPVIISPAEDAELIIGQPFLFEAESNENFDDDECVIMAWHVDGWYGVHTGYAVFENGVLYKYITLDALHGYADNEATKLRLSLKHGGYAEVDIVAKFAAITISAPTTGASLAVGASATVEGTANCDEVEALLDGTSLGTIEVVDGEYSDSFTVPDNIGNKTLVVRDTANNSALASVLVTVASGTLDAFVMCDENGKVLSLSNAFDNEAVLFDVFTLYGYKPERICSNGTLIACSQPISGSTGGTVYVYSKTGSELASFYAGDYRIIADIKMDATHLYVLTGYNSNYFLLDKYKLSDFSYVTTVYYNSYYSVAMALDADHIYINWYSNSNFSIGVIQYRKSDMSRVTVTTGAYSGPGVTGMLVISDELFLTIANSAIYSAVVDPLGTMANTGRDYRARRLCSNAGMLLSNTNAGGTLDEYKADGTRMSKHTLSGGRIIVDIVHTKN